MKTLRESLLNDVIDLKGMMKKYHVFKNIFQPTSIKISGGNEIFSSFKYDIVTKYSDKKYDIDVNDNIFNNINEAAIPTNVIIKTILKVIGAIGVQELVVRGGHFAYEQLKKVLIKKLDEYAETGKKGKIEVDIKRYEDGTFYIIISTKGSSIQIMYEPK